MSEPGYEVVWPLGKSAYGILPSRPGISDLGGKTICELWDMMFRGEEIFPMLRELLLKRYPDINFIPYGEFGGTHGAQEVKTIAALADLLHQHGCDAVISGVGA
ncbi:hypothetical protein ACFLUZ_00755 [Chloroflexota bacterium]